MLHRRISLGERIIAIDPGERVGWATARVSASGNLTKIDHGITDWMKFCDLLYTKLRADDIPWGTLVFENFRLTPHGAKVSIGSEFPTVQCIGICRFLARHAGLKIVSQGPAIKSQAEKIQPAKIEKIRNNLPKSHDEAHDGDALLHLAYYHFNQYRKSK